MEDRRIERTENNGLGIVLAIILTALIVGGGVFWWRSAQTAPANNQNPTNIKVEIPNPLDNKNTGDTEKNTDTNTGNTQPPNTGTNP